MFKYRMHNNPKLAEQLMFGCTDERICNINNYLWKKFEGNRFEYYLNIVKICGNISTPRARYVIAMAYAWNSTIYSDKAIHYLELYLSNPLYLDKCKSNGIYSNQEMKQKHLCEMHTYLAEAYRSVKNYAKALENFYIALNYRPNATSPYLKIAETYSYINNFKDAIQILENAKTMQSAIYPNAQTDYSKDFISIPSINKYLDAYKQQLYIQINYPYTQKQVREIVTSNLKQNGLIVNFTQPKLKNICSYFRLRENNKYFYRYPNSETFRCSECLIELLINSFNSNKELLLNK